MRIGVGNASRILSLVLGVVAVLLMLGALLLLVSRRCFLVFADSDVHLSVADVFKSFDTVDRILDRVLSSLGLPGWIRHAYFEYHSLVRLRFKLAAGLGDSG